MRLVTATLVVFGLLWGAEASNDDVEKVEKSGGSGPGSAMKRIIDLIAGMKTEIIKDGKLEQQLFDKYQCWCERSVKESHATIAASEETLEEMESEINRLSSEIASETEDIAHKVKNIAANEKSQKDATEQRHQEQEDFEMELNNDMAKMGALEKTLDILQNNKASKGGQDEDGADDNMGLLSKNMKVVMESVVADSSISENDKQTFANFAKAPAQFFQSSAGRVKAYESQSGTIIGIMKSMLLATASDAQERSQAEIKQTAAYQSLMENLENEHANLNKQKDNLEASKANNELQMAENKKTQANTEELLADTQAFLEATTEACKEKAKEWALRSQLRLEELKNIDKGIAILSDIGGADEQAFNKPGEGSFLQMGSMSKLAKIQRQLAEIAMETGSQDVTKLVAESRTATGDWKEAMWKINEFIKRMIASHKEQEKRDIQLRAQCENHATQQQSDLEQIAKQKARAEADANNAADEQSKNTDTINALETQKDTDKATLKELNDNASQANEKMRSDLGAREHAISKIKEAINVLGAHCAANSLIQGSPEEGQYDTDRKKAPKAEFSGANKHCQSTEGLISILQMVLQDLHNEATELKKELGVTASETREQGADMRDAIQTANKEVADLSAQNADLNGQETDANALAGAKAEAHTTLTELKNDDADTCEPVLAGFAKRQQARRSEMESLQYAQTVLTTGASGNSGNEFLQVRAHTH